MSEKTPPEPAAALFTARPDFGTRIALAGGNLFFAFLTIMTFWSSLHPEGARNPSAAGSLVALVLIFGSLFQLGLIAAFIWHSLVKIEVGEAEIRWRDLRGWHRADWDEIADFYAGDKSSRNPSVLSLAMRDGRTVALERSWQNRETLQKAVIGRVGERLGLREWALRGTRDVDLPRTFGYDPRAIRRSYRWNFFPAVLIGGICLVGLLTPPPLGKSALEQDVFFLALTALSVAFMLFLGVYAGREMRVPKERLRERFTARRDGFVFGEGREDTFVPWTSVVGFDFNPTRASSKWALSALPRRIRTDCGQEFSFYASLDKSSQWETIIRRCAVNGIESKADGERATALGGIAARWSGGIEGQGDRVFSAWTSLTRMIYVWFPVAIGIAISIGPVVAFLLVHEPIQPLAFLLPAVVIAAAVATKGILKSIRVQISKDAVSYVRPWKRETLLWGEIERVETEDYTVWLYREDGGAVRFSTTPLAYGSQIAPLIEERLRAARDGEAASREITATVSAADR